MNTQQACEQYKANFNSYWPEIQFMDGPHIERVFDFLLDTDFKNKVIFAPPRSGLSTQIGCGYVQQLLREHVNQPLSITLVYSSNDMRDMWKSKLYRAMPELKFEFSLHTVDFITLDDEISPDAEIVILNDVIPVHYSGSLEFFGKVVNKFIYGPNPKATRIMFGLKRSWIPEVLSYNSEYLCKELGKVNIGNTRLNHIFLRDVNKGDWAEFYSPQYVERMQKYLGDVGFMDLYGYVD